MIWSHILAFFMELWLKRLGALYNKYKNTVQLVGSEICLYYLIAWKMYNVKYGGIYPNSS
jgi:hypothetical protein